MSSKIQNLKSSDNLSRSHLDVLASLMSGVRNNGRKLLIPYFTAGYPSLRATYDLAKLAEDCGADILELGAPFSDPLADGPTIQKSSQIALDNGVNLESILNLVEKIRVKSNLPIFIMGYYNPIEAFGPRRFVKAASASGLTGMIIPDLPPEEGEEFTGFAKESNVAVTFLAAPTSTAKRLKKIDSMSTHFVYAVTVAGVTGARKSFGTETLGALRRFRHALRKPFVAGFGVSTPQNAAKLARVSDGVVIGSALIKALDGSGYRAGSKQIANLLTAVRKSLDGLT
ncbi:MAG: tryptophan synthase subunit alpha [candidate division Zixibacteria bacterium]|nr:tryptophan synthase subunit alpha [candidate division Zixibacteria bacterium]